jgi:hypothetical protein
MQADPRTPAQVLGGLRWSARARWGDRQSYLAFSRRRHPLGVVCDETEVVIEAYMRSANTFTTVAFQMSQARPVRLAHHLHVPAQVIAGVRRGLPVLVPLRHPRDAVISVTIRSPQVSLRQALDAYRRFHEAVLPVSDRVHIAMFDDVTTDLGAVIERMNEQYGTAYVPFHHSPENVQRVYDLIDERAGQPPYADAIRRYVSGLISAEQLAAARSAAGTNGGIHVPEHRVARPSAARSEYRQAVAERYEAADFTKLRARAEAAYEKLAARAG